MSSICPAHHCGQPILQLLCGQALRLVNAGSPCIEQSSNGPCCQRVGAVLPHQVALPRVCACSDILFGLTNSQAPDTTGPPHCSELCPLWEMVAVGPVQPQEDWIPLSPCVLPSPGEEVSGGAGKGWSGPPVPPGHQSVAMQPVPGFSIWLALLTLGCRASVFC